jgi:hypothetical protein
LGRQNPAGLYPLPSLSIYAPGHTVRCPLLGLVCADVGPARPIEIAEIDPADDVDCPGCYCGGSPTTFSLSRCRALLLVKRDTEMLASQRFTTLSPLAQRRVPRSGLCSSAVAPCCPCSRPQPDSGQQKTRSRPQKTRSLTITVTTNCSKGKNEGSEAAARSPHFQSPSHKSGLPLPPPSPPAAAFSSPVTPLARRQHRTATAFVGRSTGQATPVADATGRGSCRARETRALAPVLPRDRSCRPLHPRTRR